MILTPKQKRLSRGKPATMAVRAMANKGMSIQRAVSAPVSMASTVRNVQPKIAYNGSNSCCIAHRELISTINHSVNFSVVSFALNPGLSATFPWLAPMAAQWEQYRFKKLIFNYVTRTSTTTVGSVLLAPDYDASDSAPSSEVNMASYQDCVEDVPWKNLICKLNTASMHVIQQRKYLRTSAIPSGTDVKLYDVGNFFVATTGGTSTDAIGKLYVEYEVEFFIPQKESASSSGTSFSLTASNISFANSSNLFVTPTIVSGFTLPSNVGGSYTIPKGSWLFTLRFALGFGGSGTIKMYIDNVDVTSQTLNIGLSGSTDGRTPINATFSTVLSSTSDVKFVLAMSGASGTLQDQLLTAIALI